MTAAAAERYLIPALWLAWAGYWGLASFGVKPASRSEPALSRFLHIAPLALAAFLLWGRRPPIPWLDARFLAANEPAVAIAAVALVGAGLLFAVWARRHLGRNWSGIVTIKEGHELMTSGPYALVRHPIYSGLLLALAGSALARGEWSGVLAVLVAGLALWRKLRIEERWMRERFGEQYRSYSARVAAVVPFLL